MLLFANASQGESCVSAFARIMLWKSIAKRARLNQGWDILFDGSNGDRFRLAEMISACCHQPRYGTR